MGPTLSKTGLAFVELVVKGEESDIKQMYLQIVMSPTKEMFIEHLAGDLT